MAVSKRKTQAQRRAATRTRLVEAAARLFADLGVDGVSVDALAEAAGRTSGAVYDHFGSKQGLLLAVLDHWTHGLVSLLTMDFTRTTSLEERLHLVARRVIVEPDQQTRRLFLLERELTLRAARDPRVASVLRTRQRDGLRRLSAGFTRWVDEGLLPLDSPSPEILATLFRAVILDMEMQQRIDPTRFDAESACRVMVSALCPQATRSVA